MAVILDAVSRRVVGWSMAAHMRAEAAPGRRNALRVDGSSFARGFARTDLECRLAQLALTQAA